MKRDAYRCFIEWKENHDRKPLIVRGARQVGKTYTISEFGREHFERCHQVNFERTPDARIFFEKDLDPKRIVKDLSLFYDTQFVPGKSLLFLDEIQQCPKAIMALRYFYEEMPELHVIAAGSLLEFALRREDFRMPVGRVEYLWMKPLSFGEFLEAAGHEGLRREIQKLEFKRPLNPAIHDKLLGLVKEYGWVGGMPAVAGEFVQGRAPARVKEMQDALLNTFRDDFGKYASPARHKYLDKVFSAAPKMAGKRFKYASVDSHEQTRDIKHAFELLRDAGLFYKVPHTPAFGLPLEAGANEKKFKIIFLDVGLVSRRFGLPYEVYLREDLMLLHEGQLAEQWVGQELLAAAQNTREGRPLYFWTREERSSTAEVDYLFLSGTEICPLEVKSSSAGHLKSMRLFMQEHKSKIGIRISSLPLDFKDGILSVPFYAVESLPALVDSCLKQEAI